MEARRRRERWPRRWLKISGSFSIFCMDRSVRTIGQSCADQEIQAFQQVISVIAKKFQEILPVTREVEKKLSRYADILEQALIRKKGAGVMYGEYACGTRPDYGVSGGVLSYTSAGGKSSTLGLDNASLGKAYRDAGSVGEAESIRAIGELESLRGMLELDPEKSQGIQLAGPYGALKKLQFGKEGYELHHMPPKSVFSDSADDLPCILIPRGFHRETSSYSGRMNRVPQGTIFPDTTEKKSYKDALKDQVEGGDFADAVRNEIYEIRDKFGHSLDGALDQFIDCMIRYYAEHGVPRIKI